MAAVDATTMAAQRPRFLPRSDDDAAAATGAAATGAAAPLPLAPAAHWRRGRVSDGDGAMFAAGAGTCDAPAPGGAFAVVSEGVGAG